MTQSKFKNMKTPISWCRSPGTSSSDVKGNEADRKVRCKICGWVCDRERDVRLQDGSFAGLGISFGSQQTAGTSIGDRVVPAAGSVSSEADNYYNRDVKTGCPSCGSYLYDPTQPATAFPEY